MSGGPEFLEVEQPFMDQLAMMGWKLITGSLDHPSVTGRETFREVFILDDLKKALKRINLRDGKPWLDDARASQAAAALERITSKRLMEANQEATELLLKGTSVEGLHDWDQGRPQTVHFIDWDNPDNNVFTAINQFKVDCPGGQSKGSIRPDITLFINGIPVVVVECKSPTVSEPIPSAIDQLRRYHNARKAAGEVEDNEGNEKLFFTNQFLVATSYDEAVVGTIRADTQHYLEWKDTAPVPLDQVKAELNKEQLSSQNRLIAGMLAGDSEAVERRLRDDGFIRPGKHLEVDKLADYLSPFTEPARHETFSYSREWLRGTFGKVNDPRNPDFAVALQMNMPAEQLFTHRVWLGLVGVLSGLNATVAVRSELERYLPGFAEGLAGNTPSE